MCVYVLGVCVHEYLFPERREEGVGFGGAEVIDNSSSELGSVLNFDILQRQLSPYPTFLNIIGKTLPAHFLILHFI